eukprot:CAMPEP_0172738642 /NCGR_PEP_ID=MMETSP1074-20121228/120668_1 /TAXON_ID=2916 /ORGANISM="Ceratium fusus, Strain PA161109" /LENGTH=45 /DNA_ID= /DNA_START= /DNA_END= /DNA_ORIENTATION=
MASAAVPFSRQTTCGDHFDTAEVAEGDAPGSHGQAKDRGFVNGLP